MLAADVCTLDVVAVAPFIPFDPFVVAALIGWLLSSFCCKRALCLREPVCICDIDKTCSGGRAIAAVIEGEVSRRFRVSDEEGRGMTRSVRDLSWAHIAGSNDMVE